MVILLHGLGMSRTAWAPVLPCLTARRRVIAFDIAGFGATPPLADGVHPTVANLADALERSLDAIGRHDPVDIAGNSLGGCLALELARRGRATSVVAISPCGLWRHAPPRHVGWLFRSLHWGATHATRVLTASMRFSILRELMLAVPLSSGSRRMPVDAARQALLDLARATAFQETFEHTRPPFRGGGIRVPLTIVFGDRDWVLTPSARRRDALPAHTTWITKPGWGHVPMWVDPDGVAALILGGCAATDGRVARARAATDRPLARA